MTQQIYNFGESDLVRSLLKQWQDHFAYLKEERNRAIADGDEEEINRLDRQIQRFEKRIRLITQ